MAAHSRFVRAGPHDWHVQEAGEGPTILLIHGAGGGTQSFRHLFPLLARDHHVVTFDLPGQGFTRLGALRRCGLDPMAADIATLVAAQGWSPDVVVGHSAGVAIALRMALDGDGGSRIVGINGALSNFSGIAGLVFPVMAKALAAMPFVANVFTASATRPGSVERLIEGTGSRLPPEDLRWYRALVSDDAHVDGTLSMMSQWSLDGLLRRLPEIDARVLLLVGDRDRAVPPASSRRAADRLPRAEVATLSGLGHLAHEEDAGRVLAAMAGMLAPDG